MRIPHDNLGLILRYPMADLFREQPSVKQNIVLGNDCRHITARATITNRAIVAL